MHASLVVFLGLVSVVVAQSPVWGQCGGIGWTGATTCASGSACSAINPYYSQCLPSTSTPSTSSAPTSTSGTSAPAPSVDANYWFSFGDSYTQTGFVDTDTLPAVGNPLGNPPYPGYTAVGGENWIDFDTTTYNNSLVFTYNYAYGGATINASLVAPYEPTVLSLGDQVTEFLDTVANQPPSTSWTSSNSLFSFWIGINDIGNSYYLSGDRSADVGARNFLFLNVPPVDRSPLMLAQSTDAQALEKSVILDFNSKLATRVQSFEANHTGVSTFLWDSNAAFTTILDDPTAYGFQDATSYGSGDGLFWGNNLHPSSAAHKYWGEGVAAVLNSTVW